ncbi:mitochondrial ribosomal protein S25-domain-containing protein [Russula emetica]|nr:mitochondrial ribosomal protein S25-domain-containing protein [Russula emetica]
MVRRIASQVHKQASRLTRAGFFKTPPVWYEAVLDHPPLPLPPREPPSRTSYDDCSSPSPTTKTKKTLGSSLSSRSLLSITYVEDDIRRQFFRDHPFEAFRPRTLTEAGAIENEDPIIRGLNWTRLNQRSRNPSPEDAVQFALNLHQAHGLTLSDAYATSIAQFRTLRAVQHVATRFAAQAASAYGAYFGPSATAQGFEVENRVLDANELRTERLDDSARLARNRWRMVTLGNRGEESAWSRGEEYVRLWKEGVRPDYSPALTESVAPVDSADFMGTRGRRFPP